MLVVDASTTSSSALDHLTVAGLVVAWATAGHEPPGTALPGLVVDVHDVDRVDTAVLPRAVEAGAVVLDVGVHPTGFLLGPVTVPDRVGCSRCGRVRTVAAGAWPTSRGWPARDVVERLRRLLVEIVEDLVRTAVVGSALDGWALRVGTEVTRHRVVPTPSCRVCGGARRSRRRSPDMPLDGPVANSADEVVAALAGWVDPVTGIVTDLLVEAPDDDDPGGLPFVVTTAPPHVVDDDGQRHATPVGWGKGWTPGGAVLSAVAEALERHAPSLPNPAQVTWARSADLDGEVLDPRDLHLPSGERGAVRSWPEFDPDLVHPWTRGSWLHADGAVWLPAVVALLALEVRPHQLICQGTSNGLAAGAGHADAAVRAILELVERDALLATWLTRGPVHPVRLDPGREPAASAVLGRLTTMGARTELLLMTHGVAGATVLAVARGDGHSWPGATIGMATDLDPTRAARAAVLELGQTGPHLRRMMRRRALRPPSSPEKVREMLDHAAWFFRADRARDFDHLPRVDAASRALPPAEPVQPPEERLERVTDLLGAATVSVAIVDVTSADLATGPFRVVRAVSPHLQSLWFGHGNERPTVPRIRRLGPGPPAGPVHPIS